MLRKIIGFLFSQASTRARWWIVEIALVAACIWGAIAISATTCNCNMPTVGARLYSLDATPKPDFRIGYLASDGDPQIQISIVRSRRSQHLVALVTDLKGLDACTYDGARADFSPKFAWTEPDVPNGIVAEYHDRDVWLVQFKTIPYFNAQITCTVKTAPTRHSFDSRMISFVIPRPMLKPPNLVLDDAGAIRFNLMNSDPVSTDVIHGEHDESSFGQLSDTYLVDDQHPIVTARWTDARLSAYETFDLFIFAIIAGILGADLLTDIKRYSLARNQPRTKAPPVMIDTNYHSHQINKAAE